MRGLFAFAALLTLLSGCATIKPTAPPAMMQGNTVMYVSPEFPEDHQKSAAYSVPDSYFGVSSHKTGSLAAGVAFGLVGVLANVAYVKAQGENAAEGGEALFSDDLGAMLIELAPALTKVPSSPQQHDHVLLQPAASIYFSDENTFGAKCYLHVAFVSGGETNWTGRYTVSSTQRYEGYTTDADKVRQDLKQCFADALELFALHRQRGTAMFKPAYVQLEKAKLTLPIVYELLPGRLVYFDGVGLSEMAQGEWKSAIRKPDGR